MGALVLIAVGFVGTFIWPISPDAAVTAAAATQSFHPLPLPLLLPLLLGVLTAFGQAIAHILLYVFGGQLRRRWTWLDQRCERVRLRHASRLRAGLLLLGSSSGLLGLPPTSITAVLAPGLDLPARRLLPLIFIMRVIRFTVLAAVSLSVGAAVQAHP